MTCLLTTGEALNEHLEKFWRLECYDNDKVQRLSTDEKYCEQHFERTTTRANDGRFIVRLPLREKSKFIGDNREITLKRLSQLERRFKSNDIFRERYIKFLTEYANLGHRSLASEPPNGSENIVYLPHQECLKKIVAAPNYE